MVERPLAAVLFDEVQALGASPLKSADDAFDRASTLARVLGVQSGQALLAKLQDWFASHADDKKQVALQVGLGLHPNFREASRQQRLSDYAEHVGRNGWRSMHRWALDATKAFVEELTDFNGEDSWVWITLTDNFDGLDVELHVIGQRVYRVVLDGFYPDYGLEEFELNWQPVSREQGSRSSAWELKENDGDWESISHIVMPKAAEYDMRISWWAQGRVRFFFLSDESLHSKMIEFMESRVQLNLERLEQPE